MLYCRKNEFFLKIHLTTLMSCGFRKKKLKKKILLKRSVVKRQTVEVIGFRSVNIDLTG